MRRFLYGRNLQFSAGSTTQPEMQNSVGAIGAKEKKQNLKAIEDQDASVIPKLLLHHFRECMNPSGWYSMPVDLFCQQPMRPLVDALTHTLPSKGSGSSNSLLPVTDKATMTLSLCDREEQSEKTMIDQLPFMSILDNQLDHEMTAKSPMGAQRQPDIFCVDSEDEPANEDIVICKPTMPALPSKMLSHEMVRYASNDHGLIVFRVSDKKPALKKRPLAYADALTSDDFAIRMYKVEDATSEEVTVSAIDHPTVPLTRLFGSHAGTEELVDKLLQWSVSRTDHSLIFDQQNVGQPAFEIVLDVLQAGAVTGSSTNYDIAGLQPGELQLVQALVKSSILLETQDGAAVQLSASALSCNLVLSRPRAVFDTRIGVSCELERLSLKKRNLPSQWELFLQLRQQGWRKSDWTGTAKALRSTCFKPGTGMEQLYFHDSYWYWLCLLNCESLDRKGFTLYHGQLEAFYQTAIRLGQTDPGKLSSLSPGQKASVYRAMLDNEDDDFQSKGTSASAFLEMLDDGDGGSCDSGDLGGGDAPANPGSRKLRSKAKGWTGWRDDFESPATRRYNTYSTVNHNI